MALSQRLFTGGASSPTGVDVARLVEVREAHAPSGRVDHESLTQRTSSNVAKPEPMPPVYELTKADAVGLCSSTCRWARSLRVLSRAR